MKLRPGCGCLVILLGIMNLLIVLLMVIGLIRGTMNRSPMAIAMLLVFVSDVIVCLMVGVAARRYGKEPASANAEQDEGEEPETGE